MFYPTGHQVHVHEKEVEDELTQSEDDRGSEGSSNTTQVEESEVIPFAQSLGSSGETRIGKQTVTLFSVFKMRLFIFWQSVLSGSPPVWSCALVFVVPLEQQNP